MTIGPQSPIYPIQTGDIADEAVTGSQIAAGAITEPKLDQELSNLILDAVYLSLFLLVR